MGPRITPADDPHFVGLMLCREFCSLPTGVHAVSAAAGVADSAAELSAQTGLFREVLGDPFPPVPLGPRWLTSSVDGVARAAYAGDHFDRLPVLADALEDAGCDDAALLAHLRGPGPHVRGCWALDVVSGRD